MRPIGRTALRGALLALLALLGTEAAPALTELEGRREATFRWAPASGPVTAYAVQVSRNGGPFQNDGLAAASAPKYRVRASYGERIAIRVAALGNDGERGDFSTPSETVRFVRSGSGGGSGDGPDGGSGDGDAGSGGTAGAPASVVVTGRLVDTSDAGGSLVPSGEAARLADAGGQPYSLHFVYDPGAADEHPADAQTGEYRPSPGFLSFSSSTLSALCADAQGRGVRFLVVDDIGASVRRNEDLFSASSEQCTSDAKSGVVVREANVLFTDASRAALRNDRLADATRALDRFESGIVEIRGCPASKPGCDLEREGFALTGNVQAVPEPAAGLLAPTALGALALLAERRRRRA